MAIIQAIVNEDEVRMIIEQRVAELVREADGEVVFWGTEQLMKATGMGRNFIKDNFFYDPRFPKYKIGKEWRYPVKATKEFLEIWIREQPQE